MLFSSCLCFLIFDFQLVFSANILYLSAVPSHSHHMWNRFIALELVKKGHNVTFAGADKDDSDVSSTNLTFIQFEGSIETVHDNIDPHGISQGGIWSMMTAFYGFVSTTCQHHLKTEGLKTLINYPNDFKFDLILYDISLDYCLYPLIVKFNYPPTIGTTAFLIPSYISHSVGNSLHSSYIPHVCASWSDNMTFYQRLLNFVATRYDLYVRYTTIYNDEEVDAKKVFGDNIPGLKQVERHIKLILANTDPLLDFPQPLPPNIIPIGGLLAGQSKELPADIQETLDNAKNGVILFSLGSLVRSDQLKDSQKRSLLDAFSRLKELVIWKYESDLDNLPENVIIRKWLPQRDMLRHPNIKLFIGHGGASSTQEAIYNGIPIIILPFIADQKVIAKRITERQFGTAMDLNELTTDYIYNKIREVLDNPVYSKNMKKTSQRLRDQPQTPLERAIFWIEYILKHGDSDDFLSPKARDMPYYQAEDIDIIVFLTLMLIVFLIVSFKVIEKLSEVIIYRNGGKR